MDENYSEPQNAMLMPSRGQLLSLDMLEDKALGGLRVGWEFGFLSDFLNGKHEPKGLALWGKFRSWVRKRDDYRSPF